MDHEGSKTILLASTEVGIIQVCIAPVDELECMHVEYAVKLYC